MSASMPPAPQYRFYQELARWWPLISPVEDYAGEAAEFVRVLQEALPGARTVLELGSGGGHNACYLRRAFAMTLVDLSADMLAVSRRLNPDCEHFCADMRTLDLGRTFDAVFVHDAIDYMTSEADLAAAIARAWEHTRPGGVALFVPDALAETFEPGSDCGGSDADDGSGVRFLEWSHSPARGSSRATVDYAFIVREADGRTQMLHETHHVGVHARARWLALLAAQGFAVDALIERTDEERTPRTLFLGRRPD